MENFNIVQGVSRHHWMLTAQQEEYIILVNIMAVTWNENFIKHLQPYYFNRNVWDHLKWVNLRHHTNNDVLYHILSGLKLALEILCK